MFVFRAFSVGWWSALLSTGLCLGLTMSVKYVAVFTVMFVGLHTAYQLLVVAMDPGKPYVGDVLIVVVLY